MEVVYTDDPYFEWLCNIVGAVPNYNGVSYFRLCDTLHKINYKVNMDDRNYNRAYDGLCLRRQYVQNFDDNSDYGSASNRGPCTMFELLVALSQRISFIIGTDDNRNNPSVCFFILLKNLRIAKYNDEIFDQLNGEFFVSEAANRVIFEQYDSSGNGGLFPLRHPSEDQHKKDIWYQMHAWIQENYKF